MRPSELLHPRPEGLYCPPGDFYVDAMRRFRARSSRMRIPIMPGPATAR